MLDQVGQAGRFTAESDQQIGTDVGMTGASQRPGQIQVLVATDLDGATALVGQRDDAINVGIIAQPAVVEGGGDVLGRPTPSSSPC